MPPHNGTIRDRSLTPHASRSVFIVVMGVSGTGKSTLGSALAQALQLPYVEGDDLHPKSNVAKMSAEEPLTDADREPWLRLIRETAVWMAVAGDEGTAEGGEGENKAENGRGVVISSSALKKYYRDILRGKRKVNMKSEEERETVPIPGVGSTQKEGSPVSLSTPELDEQCLKTFFVFIDGPRDVLMERMEKRPGHFMKPSMLDSQLSTLESPLGEEGVIVVSIQNTTEEQVRVAIDGLRAFDGFRL